MKTALRSVITLGLAVFLSAVNVQAQFSYVTNNGNITITQYIGPGGAVTIPDRINGLSVTTIGGLWHGLQGEKTWGAFAFCEGVTHVTIPDSVISIDEASFLSCGLDSLTIGDGVTHIGEAAFESCGRLTSVTIPESVVTMDQGAFGSCVSLTNVTIGGRCCQRWYFYIRCLHQSGQSDHSSERHEYWVGGVFQQFAFWSCT